MADNQVRINVDFPTYDTLPDDQKSLVNFLMENGAVYFRGEYDENGNLLHMAGSIGLNYQSPTLNPLILYTPDKSVDSSNPFSLTHLPDKGASISKVINFGEIVDEEENLHYEGGIIDCNTVLCECDTSLRMYAIRHDEYDPYYDPYGGEVFYSVETRSLEGSTIKSAKSYYTIAVEDTGMINIPVKVWTTFGDSGKVNKDRKLLPSFIVDQQTNSYESDVVITKAQFYRNTNNENTHCDYQLRTSNFIIKDFETGEEHDVFYKVGIVPPPGVTVDEVKEIAGYSTLRIAASEAITETEHGYTKVGYSSFGAYSDSSAIEVDYDSADPSTAVSVTDAYGVMGDPMPISLMASIIQTSYTSGPGPVAAIGDTRTVDDGDSYAFFYYTMFENVPGQEHPVKVNPEDLPERFLLLTEETGDRELGANSVMSGTDIWLKYTDQHLDDGVHVGVKLIYERNQESVYYFTSNGANETESMTLADNTQYPLYNADGTRANYPSSVGNFCKVCKKPISDDYIYGESMYVNTNNGWCYVNTNGFGASSGYFNFYTVYQNGPFEDAWCLILGSPYGNQVIYDEDYEE